MDIIEDVHLGRIRNVNFFSLSYKSAVQIGALKNFDYSKHASFCLTVTYIQ